MSWNNFDTRLNDQKRCMQLDFEIAAIDAVRTALAQKQGVRDAVTAALNTGITEEEHWHVIVNVIQDMPMALAADSDQVFYRGCPKPFLEEMVAGDRGVFSQLLDYVSKKKESGDTVEQIDNFAIRLMHMVIDSLHALGQTDRLKQVGKLFVSLCESKCEDGRVPGSVYHKLLELKALERRPQKQNNDAPQTSRPVRTFTNGVTATIEKPEKTTGALHRDERPAKPPKWTTTAPDNSMAAQLAKVVAAAAPSSTVN